MKVTLNPEIELFFNRCMDNMMNENKNAFLGMIVTRENERKIQRKMKKAGFPEFQGPEEAWPTLFIRTSDYLKTPYHSHIRLDQIIDSEFRYSKETLPANELFSISSIHPDEHRELNDWMTLRALDKPYDAAFLWQGNEVWMLDAPSEANTNDPYAKKAKGKVLTFGLGIGYFIYMAMLNPQVKSITVIEHSPAVIAMFKKFILPQFPKRTPLTIIEGDAYDYFNKVHLETFDYVYVDIWQSNDDGFLVIEKLLEQYLPKSDKVDFWIESSCFEFLPALIFVYFRSLAHHKNSTHENHLYHRMLKKIKRYFESIDTTVSDIETLKHYMYDPETLRKITSIKL